VAGTNLSLVHPHARRFIILEDTRYLLIVRGRESVNDSYSPRPQTNGWQYHGAYACIPSQINRRKRSMPITQNAACRPLSIMAVGVRVGVELVRLAGILTHPTKPATAEWSPIARIALTWPSQRRLGEPHSFIDLAAVDVVAGVS
jgi:hypothetical protein